MSGAFDAAGSDSTLVPPAAAAATWRSRLTKIALLFVLGLAVLVLIAWIVALVAFRGENLRRYDSPRPASMGSRSPESEAHAAAAREIATALANPPPVRGQELLLEMRKQLDQRGAAVPIVSRVSNVESDGVRGEWVIAPGADDARRMLYLHGGGYVAGSSRSHRPITSRMSQVSGAAVLALDYRLMPEHSRRDGIDDCRAAYRWLLKNGPAGPAPVQTLFIAGDSSGGNLALTTVAWARDTELRQADAVVVISPQTDATFASPSLLKNLKTDVMQGPGLGPAIQAPRALTLWASYLMQGINPSSPLVSPLRGSLARLPPTLLQASEAEMFLDDAVRYANKAKDEGSTATLQTWPFVMHVWHAFDVPEADEAFATNADSAVPFFRLAQSTEQSPFALEPHNARVLDRDPGMLGRRRQLLRVHR